MAAETDSVEKTQSYDLLRNEEHGFMQITPTPTVEELSLFYNKNYYDTSGYAISYSPQELIHKTLPAHELLYLKNEKGTFLDIGCGEGFVLAELNKAGWDVYGLDFSHDGVERHFPHLTNKVKKGDVFESIDELIAQEKTFDVIACNNLLEHVRDPLHFLKIFKGICHSKTMIRIQVPNDFSWFQNILLNEKYIEKPYWVAPPGHLNYFNNQNLPKLLNHFGYTIDHMLGDFPIELFLLNEQSNYSTNPLNGPFAHNARIDFDTNLFVSSMRSYIAFRKGCGESGVCRNLIAYCSLTQ